MNDKLPEFFETICLENNAIYNLKYHEKRIFRTIGKNYNLQALLNPPTSTLTKCKLIYNQNEVLEILYSPYKKKKIKTFKIVPCDTIEYPFKSTNRKVLESLYEKRETCDEIIIVKNGYITDTSIANIYIQKDDQWFTPKEPLLHGTMRQQLLEKQKVLEASITINDLFVAKKIAISNAMIGFDVLEEFWLIL